MTTTSIDLLRDRTFHDAATGFSLDLSRTAFEEGFFASMEGRMQQAFSEMHALEGGAIANADEQRMVGHYWLRAPELAPAPDLSQAIRDALAAVKRFTDQVHDGSIAPERGGCFDTLLVVGIGGSALGPQFVASALSQPPDRMVPLFLDNTDPDGMDRVFAALGDRIERTLTVVISKSGGTKETRNGMLETAARYASRGLDFGRHAVAVTGAGSELERYAAHHRFLATFPMWDWVGGRTSELSAVGLLPAALQGLDIEGLLSGARAMDQLTRRRVTRQNPAALLALAWFSAAGGAGRKAMVVLPYKDRLELFSRYLQQLVMESLGKRLDRAGREVHQGLTVYGNKGSTDQHAYVQQLRDGRNDFFATFIEVLRDRDGASMEVEPGVTSGDYLAGFLYGTREALSESGRGSLTLTLPQVDASSVGMLIALYERAVGLYASLIDVNAYHQPGVEAGKKTAARVVALSLKLRELLAASPSRAFTLDELAETTGASHADLFPLLRRFSANPEKGVTMLTAGEDPFAARWQMRG